LTEPVERKLYNGVGKIKPLNLGNFIPLLTLANNEKYSEEEPKEKKVKFPKFVSVQDLDMDGMIEILREAGYTVNKSSSAG
jgi:hypothetical protein